ncbi:hypothetical protein MJO28_000259 [Puccinia striiformis f. sp. tritici]|uniref:Uncharacterized protein n=4 Tax=Puccinia striiformis TaxID=27350 RepID=A0A0L0UW56_9BASI|nr:hypothetical protein Pst134EA_000965 [Puccinia striiformis f. sp. tritici]KAI9600074.1 hypothetical protein KEM48_000290 [Puccinia striiformis f. sp. tritici PST-130]KNE91282.1 hypothetical protein PSTG_15306 [Puccinia striiformis f. sp. tritici PST-78]POW03024.1 hypothetical protein PSTT_11364 [Puccinia striiformis]KAH9473908.1 hypothetical protein Pst134EA_000965 [Puccinia striiformis f. sp. tritici]KAI7962165.1 hypothetical protein MJO28_000259 [Puccinia striiformis f. sp. tritici]
MADAENSQGAGANERLLSAAKQNSEELFKEVEAEGGYDINYQDNTGNTALHYAIMRQSPHVMELILEHEGADVDLRNKEGKTPLLCAIEIEHPVFMFEITKSLLEAGADTRLRDIKTKESVSELLTKRIRNRRTPQEGAPGNGKEEMDLCQMIREAEASQQIDDGDIASDDDGSGDGVVDDDDVASD